MTNIVERLRQTRANMLGTDDEEHYWTCHDAADEIEQLRKDIKVAIMGDSAELTDAKKEIEMIRQSVKQYVNGLTRLTNDMLRELSEGK